MTPEELDKLKQKIRLEIWDEVLAAWPQLSDAMMSRLSEVMWGDDVDGKRKAQG